MSLKEQILTLILDKTTKSAIQSEVLPLILRDRKANEVFYISTRTITSAIKNKIFPNQSYSMYYE